MMNRRPTERTERTVAINSEQDFVRISDLIQRPAREQPVWAVFHDDEVVATTTTTTTISRRRAPRDSLVRQRPTTWTVLEDLDESNKENIGHIVKRPRRRQDIRDNNNNNSDSRQALLSSANLTAADTTTPPPKNKGKRKLVTPTITPTKAAKVAKKQKKATIAVVEAPTTAQRLDEPQDQPQRPQRERRPLEDITHLFVDPTAFYFQPWRRASGLAPRASSMRIL